MTHHGDRMTRFEIRNNDDGSLDEIVAHACDLHLEQMADGHWWMGIQTHDGKSYHLNLHSRGKINANVMKDHDASGFELWDY